MSAIVPIVPLYCNYSNTKSNVAGALKSHPRLCYLVIADIVIIADNTTYNVALCVSVVRLNINLCAHFQTHRRRLASS